MSAGFSLVEVLVALMILSIGLLGLAGLQVSGLQGSNSAYMRSAAMISVNDMIERMRANRAGAADYERGLGDAVPGPANTVAELDIVDWIGALQQDAKRGGLPGGDGSIAVDVPNSLVTVSVTWNDNSPGVGANQKAITVVTSL